MLRIQFELVMHCMDARKWPIARTQRGGTDGNQELDQQTLAQGLGDALGDGHRAEFAARIVQVEARGARRDFSEDGDVGGGFAARGPHQALPLSLGQCHGRSHYGYSELQLRGEMTMKIETQKLKYLLKFTNEQVWHSRKIVAGERERRDTSEATADRDSEAGPDPKRGRFVEKVTLRPRAQGFCGLSAPGEQVMFERGAAHDRVQLLVARRKIPVGPGFRVRRDKDRLIIGYPQICKPPKSEPLCHAYRYAFEITFIFRRMNGVDEFLKDVLDGFHRDRLSAWTQWGGEYRKRRAIWNDRHAEIAAVLLLNRRRVDYADTNIGRT